MTAMTFRRLLLWLCLGIGSVQAGAPNVPGSSNIPDTPHTAGHWSWRLPAGFPEPAVPAANPMSEARFQLGRHLFYDPRLSANGRQACGSCHRQARAFTDGRRLARGSTGETHPRNTQGLFNVVYLPTLTWANPALTGLEQQMAVPLFGRDPLEMGLDDRTRSTVLRRLRAVPAYRRAFAAAFPEDAEALTFANLVKAIAVFERGLLSGNSRYDRAERGELRLSAAEARGRDLFFGEKAECFHCHGGFNFNDQIVHAGSRSVDTPFHNTGLYNIDGQGGFPYPNRGVFEGSGNPADMGAFRAPSLRNVAVTAPYMHDGSLPTLAAVLNFYAAGGRNLRHGPQAGDGRRNPHKSELIGRIDLNHRERADLLAFLHTLTDHRALRDPRYAAPRHRLPAEQKHD